MKTIHRKINQPSPFNLCLALAIVLNITASFGMEMELESPNQSIGFQSLPEDIIGLIAGQLVKTIGTPSLKNGKDIPVIKKNIMRLACVNQQCNKAINSYKVINYLINELANRFDLTPMHAAAHLKTIGCKNWALEYAKKSGEYALFETVQHILDIAKEVAQEAQRLGFIDSIDICHERPNPHYNQTKAGFFLATQSSPSHLNTPWGQKKIYRGASGSRLGCLGLSQLFFKRIKGVIEYIPHGRECEGSTIKVYKVMHQVTPENTNQDPTQYINDEEVETLIGKENLVLTNLCGYCTVYRLYQIDNQLLPKAESVECQDYKEYKEVDFIWSIMDACYKQEHGIPLEEEEPYIYNNKIKSDETAPHFDNLHEAPEYFINLITQLVDQPIIFDHSGHSVALKALSLDHWDDCRGCELLSHAAQKIIGKESPWHIYSLDPFIDQFYTSDCELIDYGIYLKIYEKDNPITQHNINQLLQAYQQVIQNNLQAHWIAAFLNQYPDIFHTESEEEWFLLVKKQTISQEDSLLRFLCNSLHIQRYVRTHSEWKSEAKECEKYRNTLYMWIKKDHYDECIKRLGIQLDSKKAQGEDVSFIEQ